MDSDEFDELMKIQKRAASRIIEETNEDDKISLMTIINELSTFKKRIPIESVILEAEQQGISEANTLSLLDQLKTDRIIKLKEGFIQFS
jgi:hypothetical protein